LSHEEDPVCTLPDPRRIVRIRGGGGLGVSSAFAEAGGFGEGGPQSYIWAEIAMNRMKMSMDAMDTNKDGMISKDEYMKFAETGSAKKFASMDMNNDGAVSKDEWMNPDLPPGSTFYGGFL
jgi:hypothetical protein